jgi:hypothetical protein
MDTTKQFKAAIGNVIHAALASGVAPTDVLEALKGHVADLEAIIVQMEQARRRR